MNMPGRSVLTSKNKKDAVAEESTAAVAAVPAIGAHVVVDVVDGTPARGVIVDDFGDLAGTSVGIGTERVARARRWAVDIDGGHVVFVDDDEFLEILPTEPAGR